MSLRELGVFNPLREGHQAVGTRCAECDRVLGVGVRTALRPQDPHAKGTVECDLLCATCHLKGRTVVVPYGIVVVSRVKDGDASPFPVEADGGSQWRGDEVLPLTTAVTT